jgi:hypothetical protein
LRASLPFFSPSGTGNQRKPELPHHRTAVTKKKKDFLLKNLLKKLNDASRVLLETRTRALLRALFPVSLPHLHRRQLAQLDAHLRVRPRLGNARAAVLQFFAQPRPNSRPHFFSFFASSFFLFSFFLSFLLFAFFSVLFFVFSFILINRQILEYSNPLPHPHQKKNPKIPKFSKMSKKIPRTYQLDKISPMGSTDPRRNYRAPMDRSIHRTRVVH